MVEPQKSLTKMTLNVGWCLSPERTLTADPIISQGNSIAATHNVAHVTSTALCIMVDWVLPGFVGGLTRFPGPEPLPYWRK
jgi:hypothetical protein